ncbi:putative glycerol-3-phosphate dehydrogenase [NAD(+)] 1 cytosolic [Bienertia sinuspersici]
MMRNFWLTLTQTDAFWQEEEGTSVMVRLEGTVSRALDVVPRIIIAVQVALLTLTVAAAATFLAADANFFKFQKILHEFSQLSIIVSK